MSFGTTKVVFCGAEAAAYDRADMASPTATGSVRIHLVDGSRQPVPDEFSAFARVVDIQKRQLTSGFVTGAHAIFPNLPITEGCVERYAVFASARRHRDGMVFPVRPLPNALVEGHVMLVPENGQFRFDPLDSIDAAHPLIRRVLWQDRYDAIRESDPRSLATLLNICTVLESMPLPDPCFPGPLHFDWQPVWDLLSPDRVWAWADIRLVEAIRGASCLRAFAHDPRPGTQHCGIPGRVGPATTGWQEVRFDLANVNLIFHEYDRRTLDLTDPLGDTRSVDCVMVEAGMSYWGDLLSLGLRDSIPPAEEQTKCAAEMSYQLRWMVMRQEGLPEFKPPYSIE
jgi:hypothetical protein